MVARDVQIAELTRSRLHICHVSCAETVEVITWAKQRDISVIAEAAPHQLMLTTSEVVGYDPTYKVNPPLRPNDHIQTLREALADGTIDAVATGHAPNARHDKEHAFAEAACGMLGLETALAVVMETMINTGLLSWPEQAKWISIMPTHIARLADQGRPLAEGEPANVVAGGSGRSSGRRSRRLSVAVAQQSLARPRIARSGCRHSASPSALRRASEIILVAGTVLACSSHSARPGPRDRELRWPWPLRYSPACSPGATCSGSAGSTIGPCSPRPGAHGEALTEERTRNAAVVETLNGRLRDAGSLIERQRVTIAEFKIKLSSVRGDKVYLEGGVAHREKVISALRETVRAREAELIRLRDEDDVEVHHMPKRVLAEHESVRVDLPAPATCGPTLRRRPWST